MACPVCNPSDAEFVVTLCGIVQDPTEQVPPVGAVCWSCRQELPRHRCAESPA